MKRALILAIALLVAALPISAAIYGTMKVAVVDESGNAVPGATIEASSPVQIGTRTAVTDAAGEAMLAGLVPGTYTIKVTLSGFSPVAKTAKVSANETTAVTAALSMGAFEESIVITAEAPIVDTTKATVSDHVTLEEVESLPLSRDYRGYAQLVTGVNVVPNQGGGETPVDPAGKGGNNYADRGNEGRFGKSGSRDNQYYIDGLNITDMGNGRGTMTFNNEVILQQEIITSGVPAEFAGGKGFVGNVITKSGGNEFSGSVNYYLQNPSLYGDFETSDSRLQAPIEDKWDAAATFGGPIMRDRLWFFASGQMRENSDQVAVSDSASPTPLETDYLFERSNFFGKATLRASDQTTFIGQFFTDPRETTGSRDVNLVPSRYYFIEDTPETMSISGQHIFGSGILIDGRYGKFEEEYHQLPLYPEAGARNTIRFAPGENVPAYLRDLGGASTLYDQIQKRDQGDLAGTFFFTAAGSHTLKAGYQYTKLQDETTSAFNGGVSMTSLAPSLAGITYGAARDLGIFSASEYNNVLTALRREAPTSHFFTMADANGDGEISAEEFAALTFGSRAGNRDGVNFLQTANLEVGTNNVIANSDIVFLQDDWAFGQWAVNAGVRMEDWEYLASDGSTILDMDPTFAPRLGLTYDLMGDGRQKITAFYGRYYDPIRTDMVHFAGNISGTVNGEQVAMGDEWFTYRFRGSRERRDAGFAPNLENPLQDEVSLTYGINITPTIGFMVQGFHRSEDNMIEDYDPYVYFDILGGEAGELALTPADFGYPPEGPGQVNFFLANIVGAKRRVRGLDMSVERRYFGNWTGAVQYSWRDAKGNTNSDANADLQGDFLEIDPRQPYMYGKLPGSIDHQIKMYGMYRLPWNLELGGLFYWNSGAHYTESDIFLPGAYDIFINHAREDGSHTVMGGEEHPSYYTLDGKLRYIWHAPRGMDVDFFFDIYNVLNNQDAVFVEQAHNDPEFSNYQEDRALLEPRRYQLGVRLSF